MTILTSAAAKNPKKKNTTKTSSTRPTEDRAASVMKTIVYMNDAVVTMMNTAQGQGEIAQDRLTKDEETETIEKKTDTIEKNASAKNTR